MIKMCNKSTLPYFAKNMVYLQHIWAGRISPLARVVGPAYGQLQGTGSQLGMVIVRNSPTNVIGSDGGITVVVCITVRGDAFVMVTITGNGTTWGVVTGVHPEMGAIGVGGIIGGKEGIGVNLGVTGRV